MKYINTFNSHSEYEQAELELPNVSYCKGEGVHYTPDPFNGHEYVDLGLPSGTLWATKNVGADKPEDLGLMFMWGDTHGYTAEELEEMYKSGELDNISYKYSYDDGNGGMITKYCNADQKYTLDLMDDAVNVHWGGQWHMATTEQLIEVFQNCEVTSQVNNVLTLTSKINNNTIKFNTSYPMWSSVVANFEGEFITDNYALNLEGSPKSKNDLYSIRGIITPSNNNEPRYVDLGLLSGTLWMTYNFGANSETEFGQYFEYGQLDEFSVTKKQNIYQGEEEPLSSSVDIVTQTYGSDWHIASRAQFDELLQETTATYEEGYLGSEINGYKFTGSNENYIFIPLGGYQDIESGPSPKSGTKAAGDIITSRVGEYGMLWTNIPENEFWSYYFLLSNPSNTPQGDSPLLVTSAFRGSGFNIRGTKGEAEDIK